jgi:hypothetical protein
MEDKDSDFAFEVVTSKGTFEIRVRWYVFWVPVIALAALVATKCTGLM